MKKEIILSFFICLFMLGCGNRGKINAKKENEMKPDSTKLYGYNRDFLKKYTTVIELKKEKSMLALAPEWQGRVMTSTQDGDEGLSFGWINRDLIAQKKLSKHINAFGGEERIWLGPEGGQYSIFFVKGKEFTYDNWQTPEFIDSAPWKVEAQDSASAAFTTEVSVVNYSGTHFDLEIERKVSLLSGRELEEKTGISTDGIKAIAYSSDNTLINKGNTAWKKETGLLSIWMLGMFTPSPSVIVVIPVKEGDEKKVGVKVNDNYFGKISPDRLKVTGNHIFFRADGKSRGKIGIPPLRTGGVMGSYDSGNKVLTLLFCHLPEGITDYVNSAWQIQSNPFSGDAFNSYNDGPLADGSQMGPFYELETSSPAAALLPGQSMTHTQITVHITGDTRFLDSISRKILGVSLEDIQFVF